MKQYTIDMKTDQAYRQGTPLPANYVHSADLRVFCAIPAEDYQRVRAVLMEYATLSFGGDARAMLKLMPEKPL